MSTPYFDDFKNFIRDNKSIFYKDNKIIRKKFNNEIIRNSGRNSSFDKDGNELFKSLSPNDSLIHNPNQSVNYSFHENNNRKPIKILDKHDFTPSVLNAFTIDDERANIPRVSTGFPSPNFSPIPGVDIFKSKRRRIRFKEPKFAK